MNRAGDLNALTNLKKTPKKTCNNDLKNYLKHVIKVTLNLFIRA